MHIYHIQVLGVISMLDLSRTKKLVPLEIDKKIIASLLAMVFCTLLITSTMEILPVQAQLQTKQPATITFRSRWVDNLPTINAGNMPTADSGNTRDHDAIVSSSSSTNSKDLGLNHSFVSNKVVGPDRFRFVRSYWTTPDTSNGVDVGTSANGTFLGASSLPPNQMLEVDTNEGYSTLAVVLHYEGVVDLAGITAALKLPTGFKATFPLTSDRNNYDIALSDYRGHIYPGQGIVLYFPMYVLPTAKIAPIPQLIKTSNSTGVPVLGPLALHFLRTDERSILDLLDASQQNMFAKALSLTNTTFPNSTNFNGNFDLKRHYFNQFGRFIPYDFVNQVIPVTFGVTGEETVDVVTLPSTGKPCDTSCKVLPDNPSQYSKQIVEIPAGVTTKVRLAVRNSGDVPIWYLDAFFDNNITNHDSTLGINGLNPSAITSPNIPQALFSTILPLGIVGPQDSILTSYYLPANSYEEFDVNLFPSRYVAGTVQLLNVEVSWTSVIGTLVDNHYQVYFHVT
jgi:hypothetical protein